MVSHALRIGIVNTELRAYCRRAGGIYFLRVFCADSFPVPCASRPCIPGKIFLHAEEVMRIFCQVTAPPSALQYRLRDSHGCADTGLCHIRFCQRRNFVNERLRIRFCRSLLCRCRCLLISVFVCRFECRTRLRPVNAVDRQPLICLEFPQCGVRCITEIPVRSIRTAGISACNQHFLHFLNVVTLITFAQRARLYRYRTCRPAKTCCNH